MAISGNILVIEDNHHGIEELLAGLRNNGHTVEIAQDGAKGLDLALSKPFDLILLDISIPKINGLELCRTLTQNSGLGLPVIFLTGAEDEQTKLQGFAAGCVDYITKTASINEACARIHVHMNLSHQTRTIRRNTNTYSTIVSRALGLLLEAEGHRLSVREVAAHLSVSESTLRRKFASDYGMPLMSYIREVRFDYAKRLLQDTNNQISEIAYEIGYRSAGDFSTAFRKRFGVSPSDYRLGVQPATNQDTPATDQDIHPG